MANPSRSMGRFKGYCTDRAKDINEFLSSLEDRAPTPDEVLRLKELCTDAKDQFRRMHTKWEDMADDITDDTVYKKCEEDYEQSKDTIARQVKAAEAKLKDAPAPASGAPQQNASGGNTKIDDTLKPRQELLRSFTLEEANIWFDGFKAYFNHNEKVIQKLPPSVRRQILNNSIEAGLANALQADDEVTAETPIIGDNGCLSRLRQIFLEKNPLFLRRHRYQQCRQTQGESVAEWWVRKKAKERECELDKITIEDICLLELIRGVRDPKLKEEFLKKKKPTLNELLEIAGLWQTASHVGKEMDDSVSAKKTSNYKAGKADQWAKDAEDRGRQTKETGDACQFCGKKPKHDRPKCPAKDSECRKCKKRGHWGNVCKGGGRGRSQSKGRGSGKSQSQATEGTTTKTVRVSRVCSGAIDDAAPTPLMNVIATPQVGTPFRFNVLPDTGCEQTVISQDLVTANGMEVDTNLKKRLKAANGAPMKCSGSVVLRVAFQGAETDVLALATPSLREEVLLSWKALQHLGIISKDFPNRIIKVEAVSATPQKRLELQ